jgi:hypothetical protein
MTFGLRKSKQELSLSKSVFIIPRYGDPEKSSTPNFEPIVKDDFKPIIIEDNDLNGLGDLKEHFCSPTRPNLVEIIQTRQSVKSSPSLESTTYDTLPAGINGEILDDKDRRKGDRCMYTTQVLLTEDDEHGSPRNEIGMESERTPWGFHDQILNNRALKLQKDSMNTVQKTPEKPANSPQYDTYPFEINKLERALSSKKSGKKVKFQRERVS